MAVTVKHHKDPGAPIFTVMLALSAANLFIKAALWIFATTVMLGMELWPLIEPLVRLL